MSYNPIAAIMHVITDIPFYLQSPRYPLPYPADVEECWMRTPTCGYGVQLEFEDFDVSLYKVDKVNTN